jgi:cell division protease FtsH
MMMYRRVGIPSRTLVRRRVVANTEVVQTQPATLFENFRKSFVVQTPPPIEIDFSEFVHDVINSSDIQRVDIAQNGSELRAYTSNLDMPPYKVYLPMGSGKYPMSNIMNTLMKKHISVRVRPPQPPPWFDVQNIVMYFFQFTLLFAVARMFFNSITGSSGAGGIGGIGGMTETLANLDDNPTTNVTFDEVAGCDNAKRDLMETVDFLKNPEKYLSIGAKMPKGILMVGPPGTGKTRLARAVAGEAGVPFFSCSGSEFIQMFVGVGAARIRSLFKRAQEKAPCIIFIDEIDAIGKKRGGGMFGGGGHEEHDQTINQLLTLMDGFKPSEGIIIIAATNRPETLDDALLRPGRFDRRVIVELPDVQGRDAILRIHARNKKIADDVDLQSYARITAGFSGADLENLCNEACIHAARASSNTITAIHFDQALEKLTIGEERRTSLFTEEQRELIAYHEAGHAVMGMALAPEFDKIRKVSIVPRGAAGGITYFEPKTESNLVSREYLENQIMVTLGGRIAEELVFGEYCVTTGASGDFERVTELATDMITVYGFAQSLAPMNYTESEGLVGEIEMEIHALVSELYERARHILEHEEVVLHSLAAELLEKETLHEIDLEKYVAEYVYKK